MMFSRTEDFNCKSTVIKRLLRGKFEIIGKGLFSDRLKMLRLSKP